MLKIPYEMFLFLEGVPFFGFLSEWRFILIICQYGKAHFLKK